MFENIGGQFNDDIDGTITANLKGFDIVENADNEEEVLDLIAEELVEYANNTLKISTYTLMPLIVNMSSFIS